MRAGKLVHVITLQRVSGTTISDAGTPTDTWSDLATLRAERVDQSTEEFMRAAGATDETAVIFRTRWIDGVTNADRVMFGGEAFNLRAVVPFGRNGMELRCWRQEAG